MDLNNGKIVFDWIIPNLTPSSSLTNSTSNIKIKSLCINNGSNSLDNFYSSLNWIATGSSTGIYSFTYKTLYVYIR